MAKGPRHILPNRVYEISTRTFQEQLLLTPSPWLNKLIHGVIGRALKRYEVQLFWYVFMCNHNHMMLAARRPSELVAFIAYVNSNVASEVNRLLGRRGAFWGAPYEPLLLSEEPGIQERRLAYLIGQGCKEGLVSSPRELPGASPLNAVLKAARIVGTWVDWTSMYQAARRKLGARPQREYQQEYEVTLSSLPAWQDLDEEQQRERIAKIVTDIEEQTAEENAALGREPAGAAKIIAGDPYSRPRHSKRGRSPRFLWLSIAARNAMRDAYRCFAAAYREASQAYRAGNLTAEFPPWSFPPPLPMTCGPPTPQTASG